MDVRALFRTTALLAASLVGVLWAGMPELHAQGSAELSAVYGRGVHAYFANQSAQAEQQFTQVIQAGSSDPRVFYFRAMVRIRMGRQHEAENDMQVGADYEARNPGSTGSISKALERVQGHARRKLEQFRRQARLNRVQLRRHQSHARYETLQRRETQILRKEVDVPLGQLIHPSPQTTIPADVPATVKQMQPPAPQPASPMLPAEEPADSEEEFFGDLSEPSEPEEANVFGDASKPAPDLAPMEDSTAPMLAPADKVKSGKLLGILGRVVGRAMPWKNIQLPPMGPARMPGEGAPADNFEFGPIDEPAIGSKPPIETQPADETDAFGDGDVFSDDDPFGVSEPQPESNPPEDSSSSEAEEMPEEAAEEDEEFDLFDGL